MSDADARPTFGNKWKEAKMTGEQQTPEGQRQAAYWRAMEEANNPWQVLASLACPLDCDAGLKALLIQHGCEFREEGDHLLVVFPAGTLMREILPRRMEARWRIKLPDGLLLMRQEMRHREEARHDLKNLLFVVV